MNSITDYLESVEAREKKATPGPWRWYWDDECFLVDPKATGVLPGIEAHDDLPDRPDSQFIAHARTDIPTLLQLVRKYREALEQLCSELNERTHPEGNLRKVSYVDDVVCHESTWLVAQAALIYDPRANH